MRKIKYETKIKKMNTIKKFITPENFYLEDLTSFIGDKTNRLSSILRTLKIVYKGETLSDLLSISPEELGKKHLKMGYKVTIELFTGILENFEFIIKPSYIFLNTDHGRYWNMNKTQLQEINEVKRKIINTNKDLAERHYQAHSKSPSEVSYLKLRSSKICIEIEKNQKIIEELKKTNEELSSEQIYLAELLENREH